jgi:hypothetical protein
LIGVDLLIPSIEVITGFLARKPGCGPASSCEPYRELIALELERGRNSMGIWQDLVDSHGFAVGYQSVRRFVRNLRGAATPEALGDYRNSSRRRMPG